jgi:hypothetical protein
MEQVLKVAGQIAILVTAIIVAELILAAARPNNGCGCGTATPEEMAPDGTTDGPRTPIK